MRITNVIYKQKFWLFRSDFYEKNIFSFNGHILESSEKSGEWYKVTYYDSDIKKTFTGYIHNSQLKEIVGKLVITSSEGYSNIREKPTTKSTIKTRLKTGQTVYAISKTADDWYYIRYNGNEYGYIYSNQVAKK